MYLLRGVKEWFLEEGLDGKGKWVNFGGGVQGF